jgi:hypothetical protein
MALVLAKANAGIKRGFIQMPINNICMVSRRRKKHNETITKEREEGRSPGCYEGGMVATEVEEKSFSQTPYTWVSLCKFRYLAYFW